MSLVNFDSFAFLLGDREAYPAQDDVPVARDLILASRLLRIESRKRAGREARISTRPHVGHQHLRSMSPLSRAGNPRPAYLEQSHHTLDAPQNGCDRIGK